MSSSIFNSFMANLLVRIPNVQNMLSVNHNINTNQNNQQNSQFIMNDIQTNVQFSNQYNELVRLQALIRDNDNINPFNF